MKKTQQTIPLYALRYWPLWLLAGIVWMLSQLPYRWQLRIGQNLGRLLVLLPSKSRHTTAINLRLCFPDLDVRARRRLLRKNFESVGIGILETALGWWGSAERLQALIHIQGLEHIDTALKKGKGAILCGMHFTTLHLVSRLLTLEFPVALLYRHQKNPVLDYIAQSALRKHYKHTIAREDMRGMVRCLQKNIPICYTPDTDAGKKSSVFAPFFGILAASVTATSRLAKISGTTVIPSHFQRRSDGSGYDIIFYPALENFPTEDLQQDAVRINQVIEHAVRRCPEQYIWQYKRFKTRPVGEKRFY